MSEMPESMQGARLRLSNDRPYLSAALWALKPVEKKGIGTFAVDKFWRLYYDPDITWTPEEIAGVLYHEVSHLLRDHPGRAELVADFNPEAWNICADAEINDDLLEEGVKLPAGCVQPEKMGMPTGLLAEEYYAKLPRIKVSGGKGQGKADPASGKCGSASGTPQDWEESAPSGDPNDPTPGITGAEGDLIRRQVAQDVKTAESGDKRGTVPAWMKRWAEDTLNPKIPWQKILRGMVRHAIADISGMTDYTYRRPSRRQSVLPDVVLPSLRQPVPSIAVVVDTSGSMGTDRLEKAMAEVAGILKSLGQREGVDAIVCDAAVAGAKKVFKANQIELTGGGGTDMRVGVDYALKKKPHAIIVITDGYTPWPDHPVGATLICCLVSDEGAPKPPEWIKTVSVD